MTNPPLDQREIRDTTETRRHGAIVAALHHVALFASLGEEDLANISDVIVQRQVTKGAMITLEGHPAEGLYIIVSGHFKRFKAVGKREQILKLLHAGDAFGEVPLLDGGLDPASTQALEPGVLYFLPGSRFDALRRSSPALESALIQFLAGRLRYFTGLVEDLSLLQTIQRVAKLILDQSDSEALNHLTQTDIAALIGTVREVIGRTLSELEDRGAIDVKHGHITIRDRTLLQAIVDREIP